MAFSFSENEEEEEEEEEEEDIPEEHEGMTVLMSACHQELDHRVRRIVKQKVSLETDGFIVQPQCQCWALVYIETDRFLVQPQCQCQSWAFWVCGSLIKVKRSIPGQNEDRNKLLLGQAY